MTQKYAIYIVSGDTGARKLFAVCSEPNQITRHRNIAQQTLRGPLSSDHISIRLWELPQTVKGYSYFPGGNPIF
jgi:hypothetical protein